MRASRVLLLAPLASACATLTDDPGTPAITAAHPVPPSAAAAAPAAEPAQQAARPRRPDLELEIWNDPDFRRRFAESYLAETEIEPTVTVVERDELQEIMGLIAAEKTAEAVLELEAARGPATSATYDFTLGNVHFQEDRLEPALAAYRDAVGKFPKFRRAWQNMGIIHVRRAEYADAAEALTRVIELGGSNAVTYGMLGFAYDQTSNHVAAESAYRMASLLAPDELDWQMGLARSFFEQKRYDDAVAMCDLLIAQEPDRKDLWLLQANAFIGLEQPMRAAENFELVDRLGGSTAASLQALGDVYVNAGLYGLAVDTYLRKIEMAPGADPDRVLTAARVLAMQGRLGETERLLDGIEEHQADYLDPEQEKRVLKLRARLAVARGSEGEEASVLERIVELDPLDGEALILLGQHAARANDTERAIFWFERAEGIEGYEADAKVRHAQLLVGQRRYDDALALLRRAQLVRPRENVQQYLEQVERVAQSR